MESGSAAHNTARNQSLTLSRIAVIVADRARRAGRRVTRSHHVSSLQTKGACNVPSGQGSIVTGSGRGLGLAYAQELAAQGAAVVINDVDEAVAQEAVESITADGRPRHRRGRARWVRPRPPSNWSKTAVAQFRPVGHPGHQCRGAAGASRCWKMTDEDFDLVVNVHLRGTFTCVRQACAYFKGNDIAGRIIAIGSPTGQRGNFGQTNYAAAKAGIVGMVRTWALEMRKSGVCVNAVVPGRCDRDDQDRAVLRRRGRRGRGRRTDPDFFRKEIGFGTADDVAGLIAFLASDEVPASTGRSSAPAATGSRYGRIPSRC